MQLTRIDRKIRTKTTNNTFHQRVNSKNISENTQPSKNRRRRTISCDSTVLAMSSGTDKQKTARSVTNFKNWTISPSRQLLHRTSKQTLTCGWRLQCTTLRQCKVCRSSVHTPFARRLAEPTNTWRKRTSWLLQCFRLQRGLVARCAPALGRTRVEKMFLLIFFILSFPDVQTC